PQPRSWRAPGRLRTRPCASRFWASRFSAKPACAGRNSRPTLLAMREERNSGVANALDQGEWDYVIVGAGSAGCVLANRLSADPKNRVLLLEAGGSDNYHWVHIPVGYLYCIGNPRTDWCYRTVEEKGLNGRSL